MNYLGRAHPSLVVWGLLCQPGVSSPWPRASWVLGYPHQGVMGRFIPGRSQALWPPGWLVHDPSHLLTAGIVPPGKGGVLSPHTLPHQVFYPHAPTPGYLANTCLDAEIRKLPPSRGRQQSEGPQQDHLSMSHPWSTAGTLGRRE